MLTKESKGRTISRQKAVLCGRFQRKGQRIKVFKNSLEGLWLELGALLVESRNRRAGIL